MSETVRVSGETELSETEPIGIELAFQTAAEFDAAHNTLLSRLGKGDAKALQELLPEIDSLLERGCAGGAYIHEPAERRACQAILDFWVTQSYSAGLDVGAQVLAKHDPKLLPLLGEDRCPYLGLKAFSEKESEYFFGRDGAIKSLLSRLEHSNFVIVTGASGSGKSSLVLAGLLPALRAGGIPGSKNWNYLPPIVPGADPINRLAQCIMPEGRDKAAWIKEQTSRLVSDPNHLASVLKTLSSEPAVLVVDQFEEIFTLATQDSERTYRAFVASLLGVIGSGSPRHLVIVTIRKDFEAKLALYPELHALYAEAVFPVIEMDQANLRGAIEGPAAQIGLKFQKGVVDQLLRQMVGEETNLPLLQFALMNLWTKRHGNLITWGALNELGNIKAAIANSAQAVYDDLPPAEQGATDRVFLKLTRTGDLPAVLRNRVARGELLKEVEPDVLDRVLDRFSKANLIRVTKAQSGNPDEDLVEVVHESLLRNWKHLDTLLETRSAERERRALLQRLAEEWRDKRFDEAYLLGGLALKEAQRGYDKAHLSEIEQRYLSASESHETRMLQAQMAADEQRRFSRRLKWLTIGLALLSVVAGGSAIIAWTKMQEARTQTDKAQSLQLKAQSLQLEEEKSHVRALIATGMAEHAKDQAEANELIAVYARKEEEGARKNADHFAKLFNQQARNNLSSRLAVAGRDNLGLNKELSFLLAKQAAFVTYYSEDKKVLPDTADVLHQALQQFGVTSLKLPGHRGRVNAVVFSRTRESLVTAGDDGTAKLWNIEAKAVIRTFSGHKSPVYAVAISKDGNLATASEDRTVKLWEVGTGKLVHSMSGHRGAVYAVVFSPDGQNLATASEDQTVKLWDVTTGREMGSLSGHSAPVRAVAYSPDGTILATASEDRAVKL